MRQLARRLKDGRLELVEVPEPRVAPGDVLVRVENSIVSSGTERATIEVARSSLLAKARARPEQARAVVDRARTEGVRSTWSLVRRRLSELGPLGYSAAGTAVEVGERVRGIAPGDRVAIAGGGHANHAEVDVVPALLCAGIPDGVSSEEAAFATVGAIAMNGFRRTGAEVGATIAVIGLGLIGQLAVRIARAAGCRVLGIDLEPQPCELARAAGAQVAVRGTLDGASRWMGSADAVVVCASGRSSDPIELAAQLARDRAPVVVVGDVAMEVPRAPFYEKELELRLARSYGPGRYDPTYEQHGLDYPIGHVRWTEQRNMAAFLELIADGKLSPGELVSHRFSFADAERAFEVLTEARPVAISLAYEPAPGGEPARPGAAPPAARAAAPMSGARPREGGPGFGIVGAGAFATSTLIPGLIGAGLAPIAVASAGGLSAADAKRSFGFDSAMSDGADLIAREDLDLVVIATRHDTHAELVVQALEAGRPVYVEKPLALSEEDLVRVHDAQASSGAALFVGFNRRYAPVAVALRRLGGPRLMSYRVNAGKLPAAHWTNDLARGGGRLKGEGCHFVDFLCDQAGGDPVRVIASGFATDPELPRAATDNFAVSIEFDDRSVGTLHYAADAPTGSGKERFQMSAPGLYAEMEGFRDGVVWRGSKRERIAGGRGDKGFAAQFGAVAAALRGEAEAPSPEGFYLSTLATLAAARSLETGDPVGVVSGAVGDRTPIGAPLNDETA